MQVVQHLQPGGIEVMALDFLRLSDSKDTTWLVSLEGSKEEALKLWPKLIEYESQLLFLNKAEGWQWNLFSQLYRLFKQLKIDVVHTHHIGPMLYAATSARLAGVKKIIHTEHDAWHLTDKKRRWLQYSVMRMVNPVVVADAHEVAKNLQRYIPHSKPRVIMNGVDTQLFVPADSDVARDALGLPKNVPVIGMAGRLEPVKAQHRLLKILPNLDPSVHVAIAGEGSLLDSLQILAYSLGVSERVHFLGMLEDMPRFYQAIDIFCLPSSNEGLPLSILEAQASGVVVIASQVGGVSEAMCAESGYLVDAEDDNALALAIQAALVHVTGGVDHNHIKEQCRAFVLEHASIRFMHQQYRELTVSSKDLSEQE